MGAINGGFVGAVPGASHGDENERRAPAETGARLQRIVWREAPPLHRSLHAEAADQAGAGNSPHRDGGPSIVADMITTWYGFQVDIV